MAKYLWHMDGRWKKTMERLEDESSTSFQKAHSKFLRGRLAKQKRVAAWRKKNAQNDV